MQFAFQLGGDRSSRTFCFLVGIAFTCLFALEAHGQRASYRGDMQNQVVGGFTRVVTPGFKTDLGNPDDIVMGFDSNDTPDADSRLNLTAANGSPLRLSVVAKNHEAFASGRIYDSYDFDVPFAFRFTKNPVNGLPQLGNQLGGGGNPTSLRNLSDLRFAPRNTPLRAQVSGRVDIRGYLVLIGIGQVRAEVNVTIMDLGPAGMPNATPNDDFAVFRHKLFEREISTSYDPRFDFCFFLQGGSDFEGGGTDIAAEYKIPLKKLNINESDMDFGFEATLRRGRRYRLEMNLLADAGMHTAGLGLGDNNNDNAAGFAERQGRAIAAFWYHPPTGSTPIPGLPADFQDDFRGVNLVERFRDIWRPIDTNIFKMFNVNFEHDPPPFPFFTDINYLLDYLYDPDFPDPFDFVEINDQGLTSDAQRLQEGLDGLGGFYFPNQLTANETVFPPANPGVTTDQLSILLENDQVDFMDKFERREIEKHISANARLINLKTPIYNPNLPGMTGEWNGRYDLARDIVIQLAEGYRNFVTVSCGMTAIQQIQSADAAVANGDLDLAFRELHDAYVALRDCNN